MTTDEINETCHSSSGLIIRQREPKNLETPFSELDSFLTPMVLFYIRSHFPTSKIVPGAYQLHIDGAVRNPFSLSYQELRDMPSETRFCRIGVRRQKSRLPFLRPLMDQHGHLASRLTANRRRAEQKT